jgi:hypothetical protein
MSHEPYEKEVTFCDGCRLEIYPSDDLLEFDGMVTCDRFECIKLAVKAQKKTGEQYRWEREIDEKEALIS